MTLTINSKISSYIGLSIKSGSAIFGEDKITEKLSSCHIVLIEDSATDKYKNRLIERCAGIPTYTVIGLSDSVHRNQVLSLAITNDGLAKAIIENLR